MVMKRVRETEKEKEGERERKREKEREREKENGDGTKIGSDTPTNNPPSQPSYAACDPYYRVPDSARQCHTASDSIMSYAVLDQDYAALVSV